MGFEGSWMGFGGTWRGLGGPGRSLGSPGWGLRGPGGGLGFLEEVWRVPGGIWVLEGAWEGPEGLWVSGGSLGFGGSWGEVQEALEGFGGSWWDPEGFGGPKEPPQSSLCPPESQLRVWMSKYGWTEPEPGRILISNQEENIKPKNIVEKIDFDSGLGVLAGVWGILLGV